MIGEADMPPRTLLLTGAPGVGKTTLIRRVARALPDLKLGGFVTDEIRAGGRREGFRLDTFQGESAVLAHVAIDSPHRLGRYRVDVEALDRVVDSALRPRDDVDLYLVDEIGKMECMSSRFVGAMNDLLGSGRGIIATIHRTAGGFIKSVKERPDVEIWSMTLKNRDEILGRVICRAKWRTGEDGRGE
jgi:nucleoside-triphosphatase